MVTHKKWRLLLIVFLFYLLGGYGMGRLVPYAPLQKKEAIFWTLHGTSPKQAVLALLDHAERSLDIAIYDLNEPEIARALERAAARGVQVRMITDRRNLELPGEREIVRRLLASGVPVKQNDHDGLMHLKLIIADGRLVALGSYNFTITATNVNEEMFVIFNDPYTVERAQTAFSAMWDDHVFYSLLKEGEVNMRRCYPSNISISLLFSPFGLLPDDLSHFHGL
ncbi:MAG: hypothetical protein IMX04_07085 [Candidatus Carbobacillus altaicus]|nr:hypothetical protein [Candidatus Carbobacillus altaicus]